MRVDGTPKQDKEKRNLQGLSARRAASAVLVNDAFKLARAWR